MRILKLIVKGKDDRRYGKPRGVELAKLGLVLLGDFELQQAHEVLIVLED